MKIFNLKMFYNNTPFSLVIKQSIIPNAGQGVFTQQHIRVGSRLGRYEGNLVPTSHKTNSEYCMRLNKRVSIDAEPLPRCYMGMINDHYRQPNKTNCLFIREGKSMWVVAKRDILPGEELYVSYGEDFWS